MAFDDTYRESIQTKHIGNVGFTSTAKGVTNEAYALKNPHQVLASQVPAVDVVGTYGPLTASGIAAGLVEEHIIKLTADPTVNNNKAWYATEDNCTTPGHSARGTVRLDQWMRYAETQYKLRLYEDNGAGTAPNYSSEILPSEVAFNWEYDASAGIIYFDDDPSTNGKTTPLWGVLYTYVGDSVEALLGATASGIITDHSSLTGRDAAGSHPASAISVLTGSFGGILSGADSTVQTALNTIDDHNHDDRYYTEFEMDTTLSGYSLTSHTHTESDITDLDKYTQSEVDALITSVSGSLVDDIIWEVVDTPTQQIRPKATHQGKAIYTAGSLTIGGDLTVSGTTTTVHSQELTVADKVITVNAGEVGAGITGDPWAGIQVDRGTETDYFFVFDEVHDNFRVGISGSLQAVATREDNPIDTRVPWWNDTAVRFDTSGNTYQTVVTTPGSGQIRMYTDGTNVLSVSNLSQQLGTSAGGLVTTNSTAVNAAVDGTTVMTLTEDGQRLGVVGDTSVTTMQSTNTIYIAAAGTTEMTVTTAGIALKTGTSVNEIVDSTGTLSAASTDDQLVTAKLVYDEIATLSGIVNSLDHNTDLSGLQGGQASEYYHLTSNEYNAFSSDGTTWTFSQDLGLATGTTVDEISTTVDAASTDDQLVTAKAVYDAIDVTISGALDDYYTKTELDGGQLDNRYYTETEVDNLLAGLSSTFIDLTDTFDAYNAGRVLFTTASGVVDNALFTFDSVSGTLNVPAIQLETGGYVNEIVTTVVSGSTDLQIPTAKAVWDATESAVSAVHTHYDEDCTYSTDYLWTYDGSFTTLPEEFTVFVNGVKQRANDVDYYATNINAGVVEITFGFKVRSTDWVNITWIA